MCYGWLKKESMSVRRINNYSAIITADKDVGALLISVGLTLVALALIYIVKIVYDYIEK